jgi:hypothetical protein
VKLDYDPRPSDKYPHGYWYVYSEKFDIDTDGADLVQALVALVLAIEEKAQ